MKELLTYLIGDVNLMQFVATLLWAYLAGLFMAGYFVLQGVKKTEKSPEKFSVKYYIKQPKNYIRLILNIVAIFIAVVFLPDIFGQQVNSFSGLIVGLGSGGLIELLVNMKKLSIKK